jgi:hypothetical protein
MKRLPDHLRDEILARAFLLQLANEDLTREAAERIIAKEIVERERQEHHKPAAPTAGSNGEITLANAHRSLVARVMGMAQRVFASQERERQRSEKPAKPDKSETVLDLNLPPKSRAGQVQSQS